MVMCVVSDIQTRTDNEDFQDALHETELNDQSELQLALSAQESFWKEKSRLD